MTTRRNTTTHQSNVGKVLQLARASGGLSIEEAAARCKISFGSYRRHELGPPSLRLPVRTLQHLADGLDVELSELITAALADAGDAPSNHR